MVLPHVGATRRALLRPASAAARHVQKVLGRSKLTRKLRRLLCTDSGSTDNMFRDQDAFEECEALENTFIRAADNSSVTVAGKGTVLLHLSGGKTVCLKNCLHIPGLAMSLLLASVHRQRGSGCHFPADANECSVGFPALSINIDDATDCAILCGIKTDDNDIPTTHPAHDDCSSQPRKSPSPLARRTSHCSQLVRTSKPPPALNVQTRSQSKRKSSETESLAHEPTTADAPTPPSRNTKTHPSMPVPEDDCENQWDINGSSSEWESVDPWPEEGDEDDIFTQDSTSEPGLADTCPRDKELALNHSENRPSRDK